jgi:indolepyruvate ferredoxin oxidoreductase alpha subunit
LTRRRTDGSDEAIQRLQQIKTDVQNRDLFQIEAYRQDELAKIFMDDPARPMSIAARDAGEKAMRAIYGPVREDMMDFIKKQFIDVIHWTDDTRDTMVWRFERFGHAIKYGAKLTVREAVANPRSDFARVVLPPMSYAHEQDKVKNRWPAAEKFIVDRGLNEFFGPRDANFGIVVQGGMYNGVIRALQRLGLADIYGNTDVPLYVLNVTYPLISSQFLQFCEGKEHVLVVEEGQPEFIETQLGSYLYRAGSSVKLHGKGLFPMAGEYTGVVMLDAVESFIRTAAPAMLPAAVRAPNMDRPAIPDLSKTVPIRPPGFCTGCPERPIFAAMKLVEKELGKHQIAADIGCHLFASLPPFEIGGATMGYGLGPAANGAFDGGGEKRAIAIIGDGGFWHNGLSSSFTNMAFNKSDGVAIIVDNYYSAATGGQDLMSSRASNPTKATKNPISKALNGIGINWVRQIDRTYDVAKMRDTIREALTTPEKGPKVIVASSECMLNKQRREKP